MPGGSLTADRFESLAQTCSAPRYASYDSSTPRLHWKTFEFRQAIASSGCVGIVWVSGVFGSTTSGEFAFDGRGAMLTISRSWTTTRQESGWR